MSNISLSTSIRMKAGEYGCYCSHVELWQKIVEDNIDYALILEDDAGLVPNFSAKLNNLLDNMPAKWDIMFLKANFPRAKKRYFVLNNLKVKKLGTDGRLVTLAVAYIVTKEGAQKLLSKTVELDTPLDAKISDIINEDNLDAYIARGTFLNTYPREYEHSVIAQMD